MKDLLVSLAKPFPVIPRCTHSHTDSLLSREVVDIYSGWCGPCKAVISLFRRVKNELGDDLLKFAIVCGSDELIVPNFIFLQPLVCTG